MPYRKKILEWTVAICRKYYLEIQYQLKDTDVYNYLVVFFKSPLQKNNVFIAYMNNRT